MKSHLIGLGLLVAAAIPAACSDNKMSAGAGSGGTISEGGQGAGQVSMEAIASVFIGSCIPGNGVNDWILTLADPTDDLGRARTSSSAMPALNGASAARSSASAVANRLAMTWLARRQALLPNLPTTRARASAGEAPAARPSVRAR